jgi:hypothetical protein
VEENKVEWLDFAVVYQMERDAILLLEKQRKGGPKSEDLEFLCRIN